MDRYLAGVLLGIVAVFVGGLFGVVGRPRIGAITVAVGFALAMASLASAPLPSADRAGNARATIAAATQAAVGGAAATELADLERQAATAAAAVTEEVR